MLGFAPFSHTIVVFEVNISHCDPMEGQFQVCLKIFPLLYL